MATIKSYKIEENLPGIVTKSHGRQRQGHHQKFQDSRVYIARTRIKNAKQEKMKRQLDLQSEKTGREKTVSGRR